MPGRADPVPPCPCGSARAYAACCGRWHDGPLQFQAPDAASLMRSRYAAYVLRRAPYLLATWHPSTRPTQLDLDDPDLRWLGLEVRRHRTSTGAAANASVRELAEVEFVARSKRHGRAHRLHETSRFVREGGRWYYLDGTLLEP
ncbi:MAG TPA: YchJ family protein [Burkholderiaceae bacterium]|nr:YchJ family protein [Burkholderiaceae bacterium]